MHRGIDNGRSRLWVYGGFLVCLAVIYALPLSSLFRYAASRDLYSHIFLVPFITLYLVYVKRSSLHAMDVGSSRAEAGVMAASGGIALSIYVWMLLAGYELNTNDTLSLTIFSFVAFLLGGFFFFLGRNIFRVIVFPLLFLLFLVPMPTLIEEASEAVLQVGSAHCYAGLLTMSRTPYFRDGMLFKMPGLSLEVASQCSGIRSSLVLLITGVLAGHMFLRTGWRKLIMALVFFPIGLLRNGARILTITLFTMHIDPEIINGPVHHRGGPPFFVLSLVPLFAILALLRKTERRKDEPTS